MVPSLSAFRNSQTPIPLSARSLTHERISQHTALTPSCRREFLMKCWQLTLPDVGYETQLQAYESYFKHYEHGCSLVPTAYPLLENCTHDEVCAIVQTLGVEKRTSCESSIQTLLPSSIPSSAVARDCINFIGSAVLLINLSKWASDETLREYINRVIAIGSTQQDRYRMPLSFNARTFEVVAGIKIRWARDLLGHLETGSNGTTMHIFHNITALRLYEQSKLKDVLPPDFINETERTLSLMLPNTDKACSIWFRSIQQRLQLDKSAGQCQYIRANKRDIQAFNFWRDRLIIAKETFELSQPTNLLQFWRDDRNKVQWWTFWIAITVFILTIGTTIEGALQVYKAYHPS